MMIHVIKRFNEVDCTQINCIPSFNEALNNTADSVYSMATTHPFLKPNCLLSVLINSLNFSIKQYSKTFDIIALIAMPLKSCCGGNKLHAIKPTVGVQTET